MSVAELKERHMAATDTVNSLKDRLRQKRLLLLDTDGSQFSLSLHPSLVVARASWILLLLMIVFLDLYALLRTAMV